MLIVQSSDKFSPSIMLLPLKSSRLQIGNTIHHHPRIPAIGNRSRRCFLCNASRNKALPFILPLSTIRRISEHGTRKIHRVELQTSSSAARSTVDSRVKIPSTSGVPFGLGRRKNRLCCEYEIEIQVRYSIVVSL